MYGNLWVNPLRRRLVVFLAIAEYDRCRFKVYLAYFNKFKGWEFDSSSRDELFLYITLIKFTYSTRNYSIFWWCLVIISHSVKLKVNHFSYQENIFNMKIENNADKLVKYKYSIDCITISAYLYIFFSFHTVSYIQQVEET